MTLSITRRGLDPFTTAQREFDGFLGRLVGGRFRDMDEYLAPYGVDVREDGDRLIVEAELPGYKKEEVDINIENQVLTITAEHKEEDKQEKPQEKGQWLLRERSYSRFQRSFTLPPTVDSQSVQAKLNEGILTVTLTKREDAKPRRITVS